MTLDRLTKQRLGYLRADLEHAKATAAKRQEHTTKFCEGEPPEMHLATKAGVLEGTINLMLTRIDSALRELTIIEEDE